MLWPGGVEGRGTFVGGGLGATRTPITRLWVRSRDQATRARRISRLSRSFVPPTCPLASQRPDRPSLRKSRPVALLTGRTDGVDRFGPAPGSPAHWPTVTKRSDGTPASWASVERGGGVPPGDG